MTEQSIQPTSPSLTAELPLPDETDRASSLGTLLRRLADDGRLLVKQEIDLAKVEIQSNALSFAKRSALIAAGIVILVVGLLVLTAFLVIALGALLGDRYWLSSLIIGAFLALVGISGMLVGRSGLSKQTLAPEATVASLRESADWARDEAQRMKHDLTRTSGES